MSAGVSSQTSMRELTALPSLLNWFQGGWRERRERLGKKWEKKREGDGRRNEAERGGQ